MDKDNEAMDCVNRVGKDWTTRGCEKMSEEKS